MIRLSYLLLLVVGMILVLACQVGPAGEQGPPGPQGEAGPSDLLRGQLDRQVSPAPLALRALRASLPHRGCKVIWI